MDITFNCNKCGQSIAIDESSVGDLVDCPRCGVALQVPCKSKASFHKPVGAPPVIHPQLMTCPDCGGEVSRNAVACPKCGRKLKTEQTAVGLLAAIILGFVIFFLIFGRSC
jgi:DNA-directed RNA polymerase subunit RPC12/RpoP